MDYEKVKILKNIKSLVLLSIILFAIWAGISTYLWINIAKDTHSFYQCADVDDEHFKACFDDKRK